MTDISIFNRYKSKYVKSDTKTASGKRKSLDKGDRLARLLRGKSVEELTKICDANGVFTEQWQHLNPGRFRMQVGRLLRTLIKRGAQIHVGDEIIAKL